MKFSKYFMLAGAAALLTACSSEEPLVNGDPMTAEIAANETYAKFGLQMPEQAGTRAPENVDSKIASEYKVQSISILLFEKAATEDAATFVRKIDVTSSWEDEDEHDDIMRQSYVTVAFPKNTFSAEKSYQAMVVLNAPSGYPFPTAGDTYGTWSTTASTVTFTKNVGGSTYLTMVSAPEYKGKLLSQTLQDIPASSIVTDMRELDKTSPAANFYVHRVAAKVSLIDGEEDHTYELTEALYDGGKIVLQGWAPDLVATQSFPVQNVRDIDMSASWMNTKDNNTFYFARHSYGKGAFYANPESTTTGYETGVTSPDLKKAVSSDIKFHTTPQYIKENTVPYNWQVKNRVTRVLVKGVYQDKDGNAADFIKVGKAVPVLTNATDLLATIKTAALGQTGKTDESAVRVTVNKTAAGTYSFTEYCTVEVTGVTMTDAINNAIASALGLADKDEKGIFLYKSGECYYPIYIRHFADDEDDSLKAEDITEENPYTAAHEGRYGILRNNWYEINITGVSKLGVPTPEPTPDPIDGPEDDFDGQGLNFQIYMLNWAKRSQNVGL